MKIRKLNCEENGRKWNNQTNEEEIRDLLVMFHVYQRIGIRGKLCSSIRTTKRNPKTRINVRAKYRRTVVSADNMFQDLPQLRETTDNTERYIRDIRVTYINTVQFN
jgi:hypothetical protein